MFSLGDSYERFMGRWSRKLAPLLVQFAGVIDGEAVADIGSGTGALTAAVVACLCSPALARVPLPVPEPDTLSLLGIGAVAVIVGWRIRRKK